MRDINGWISTGRPQIRRDAGSRRCGHASCARSRKGRAARPRTARDGRLAPIRECPAAGTAHRHGRGHRRIAEDRRRGWQDVGPRRHRARAARTPRQMARSRRGAAPVAQRLWDRFRTATDFIRSRCEGYFAKMREERERHFRRRRRSSTKPKRSRTRTIGARPRRGCRSCRPHGSRPARSTRGRPRAGAALPGGVQRVLLAPARGSDRPQEDLDRQPAEEGSALPARRNARRVDRLGRGRRPR